ncbi:D-alanyl-D-alanine carboxypeptidase family protein [Pedococcus soli]
MPRRRASAAAASLVLAVGGAVVFGPTAPAVAGAPASAPASQGRLTSAQVAAAKPKPSPSLPKLPVPRATVRPELSIGGPRLASTGLVTDLPAGVPAPPALKNVAWLLADMDTGEVVAAKAPHARLLPASTLKTLTALTLIPKVGPDRVITATAADANADGTRVGIVPGATYTSRQLFEALLMSSGNDAAYALAGAGGGRAATLAAMNAKARYLGAHDTVAKDPSGLDVRGQTSSAYDLALIGRAAMQLPEFRRYVTTKQAQFPGRTDPKTKKRATYVINNHNKLLYNYDGTIGIKNGYTVAAHRTFISAVTRGGKTYLLTEMYGLDGSWRPQAAMYDWAFRYGSRARPVGTLVAPGTVTAPPRLPPLKDNSTVAPLDAPQDQASRATAAAAALPRGIDHTSAPWVGIGTLAVIAGLLLWLGSRAASARRRRDARH